MFRKYFLAVALSVAIGCQGDSPSAVLPSGALVSADRQFESVHEPAAAGLFYPKRKQDLKGVVDKLLAEAKVESIENLRALVCPHAGYEFSGPTAAIGYKQLVSRHFSTVILLGPSHYAAFSGAFVSTADAYQTPLGMIPVSPKAAEMAKVEPFSDHPRCRVVRPGWSHLSPLATVPAGKETPETWEHSLEVQLPMLQCVLPNANIVPVIFGQVDPKKVAESIIPFLDDQTLIVVSTDLSHFHPYEEAKTLDTRTVQTICDLRAEQLSGEDACGYAPVCALIDIARRKGWKAQLLDYRNSGDTSGDRTRVVGYAAIAWMDSGKETSSPEPAAAHFTPEERRFLLELARKSATAAVLGNEISKNEPEVPARFLAHCGCFVTLTNNGDLRGCIGSIFPKESLYKAVIRGAKSAATEDPRFPPVRKDELGRIRIEVSVLTAPKPFVFSSPEDLLSKLRPGVDGVLLEVEGRKATFLPQVWKQLPDKERFLNKLALKAGLPADAWKWPSAAVMTYQVEAFQEEEQEEEEEEESRRLEMGLTQ
ncbi:MAG: AmmeMemoRadiSam system protein B [Pirellulales bacterium]|nr:AmmeMemoRadiSam system protein B [Pirellulales bacterium]